MRGGTCRSGGDCGATHEPGVKPPGRHAAITLRSVAERAGVSAMTVSNVINRRGKVGKDTIARVKAAIRELGYVPNVAARQLVGARGTKVGLIYADRRTPFLDAILIGALQATTARGLQLMIRGGTGQSREEATALAQDLAAAGAEALLLIPPYAELLSGTAELHRLAMPVAAIAAGSGLPDMATVRIDNRAAMREITRLVLTRGPHRIGFVAGPFSHGDSVERLLGFRDALAEARIAFHDELMVEGRFTFDSGVEAARTLFALPEPPRAIIASNDDMAVGVIAEAQRRGLRLPDQLIVTGFDDTNVASRVWPPLSVIRQPIEEMAFRATELLIEALDAGRTAAGGDEIHPHQLIERESTAAQ